MSNSETTEARPAAVRIDDLADPQFPPHIIEMFEAVKPMADQLELTPALIKQAQTDTGLDDFGDDAFREPLGVILEHDQRCASARRWTLARHGLTLQLLTNRLSSRPRAYAPRDLGRQDRAADRDRRASPAPARRICTT